MSDIEAAKQLFFEALALLDAREYRSAELRLRDALTIAPQSVSILTNLSVALIQQKRPQEALTFAERANNVDPRNFEALLVLANCYAQARQFSAWLATCDRIIALEPGLPEVHSDRAAALNGLRRYGEALASCDRAIAIAPNAANAHTNRGNTLLRLRRLEEALLAYDHALRLKPEFAEPWAGRGHVLARQKRYNEALATYARAIKLKPDLVTAWVGRADVLTALRRLDEALSACARAVECNPALPGGWVARGNALVLLQRFDDAIAAYDQALTIEAELAEALMERGGVYMEVNRYDAAFADLDRAFAIRPDLSYLEGQRLHAKMHLCSWQGFDEDCAHLLSSLAAGKPASLPFPVLAIPSRPADQRRCAELCAADSLPAPGRPFRREKRCAGERIRIAYLSPDFREHPVAQLTAGIFASHDRSQFEVTAISFGPDDGSEIRRRLTKSFDRFVDVAAMTDQQAAAQIRDAEIDIAVDLCGYTRSFRPNILVDRPAPIQASYLGFTGTMGSSHIDYLIADHVVIPPEARADYSESIIHLPHSYFVNGRDRKIADHIPSRAELGLPEQGFVFCCFNHCYKITPDVFDIWMCLLRMVDGSVLWLRAGDSTALANLRREAAQRGVSPARLVFAPRCNFELHLARHCRADLFLDTFHYGAHTTACDALWTGLPLVTCCGATFASRVGASVLRALDLGELVTSSPDEYQALALKLAREPARLAAIRGKLKRNRDTHPLFDDVQFTRNLEGAYRAIWERSQRGEPPQDISVPVN